MKTQKIIVLDEHESWLTPLYEEFEKRDIPYQKIDISSHFYEITDSHNQKDEKYFYINRLSPSSGKRGHSSALQYTYNYLTYLEKKGARIINGSHTVLIETSKALQSVLLSQNTIPTPKTMVTNDVTHLLAIAEKLKFPIVIKPNCGGSGMNILKFNSRNELKRSIEDGLVNLPPEQILILQEFVTPKDGYIVRVEIIGGKVAYAMKVFTGNSFNLCPSEQCDLNRGEQLSMSSKALGYCVADDSSSIRFELYTEISDEIIKKLEQFVERVGLECAGIEYVIDTNDKWWVYDVNALSILRSNLKEEYGIDGWGMLADYFISEYEKYYHL